MLCNFQADIDNSGSIDYGEFLLQLYIGTKLNEKMISSQHSRTLIKMAVVTLLMMSYKRHFDKDGSGYITHDELQKACEEFGIRDTHVEDIIGEGVFEFFCLFLLKRRNCCLY